MSETVTYLGRTYTLANDLGAAIVLLDDLNGTDGGYMTVPASMVKREGN